MTQAAQQIQPRHITPPLVRIEVLLDQWGEWCNRGGTPVARGFSRSTTIGRFLRDGGVTDAGQGPAPVDADPHAERMERLMQRLFDCYPMSAQALTLQYVYGQTQGAIARELRTCVKTANVYKAVGRAWLDGAWNAAGHAA